MNKRQALYLSERLLVNPLKFVGVFCVAAVAIPLWSAVITLDKVVAKLQGKKPGK